MRTRQAFINAVFSILLQLTLAVSGLLVPRFFILAFGSAVNGLVSSISQFITYMSLVEAGVGAAATVSLYKPLADKNTTEVNGVLAAAKNFYMRSGVIFFGLAVLLVFCYPLIVENEIQDISFIRIMVAVLCINGIIDYFFLGKYRVLLMADQRGYILYGIQIIGTLVMTVVSILQIKYGASAIAVKATAAAIYVLRSSAAIIYCKWCYPQYNFKQKPLNSAFTQRHSALLHQVVGVITNNAAIILLTVMVKKDALAEVSVYSVYNLVAYSLSNLLTALSNGITPSFGQVISKKEYDTLKTSYSSYELIFFLMTFICYTCMAVLLYPFISIYSMEFTDGVNYARPILVVLFTIVGILQSIRLPGLTLICAAGHYRETRWRAIIEMGISIAGSLLLTPWFGVAGVMTAMMLAYAYRTIDIIIYSAKQFIRGTLRITFLRILRNLIVTGVCIFIGILVVPQATQSWIVWFLSAVVIGVLSLALLFVVNLIFEPQQTKNIISILKAVLKKN